ncbi:MAG: MFS transporter [Novosphingobium sp. 28-62-57]|uniref:BCD family MFS transporter n=1 Tax=unclassified Novosphingobium TaxID=2644732 RepID=UPI000BD29C14|nr:MULTISPECIES: BCD family MFS transporter [unclassified Novosphingobium]OYW49405.1 MAG: MFS transporter [Novosphingobium sp. 12-62-10]OYZ09157.1 MAG: MFS transporter [Novosphingobium sp. 28-62-57]HQS68343.1 BCD family MFS transporter [Novosphingobium sp.]
MQQRQAFYANWSRVAVTWLPFADAATAQVPLSRLLRLSLFQVSVGMAMVLLNGTLNRVMIVELGIPAWLVALLIAIPLLAAPFRALIGHRSDVHRSVLGWKRVPFIWFGTLMQFGGLAIMPFALLLMSDPALFGVGVATSALAFLLAGFGMHTTQTAGLALVGDLTDEEHRPRAVSLLYLSLLAGMMLSSLVIGGLLVEFSPTRLVQVIQGAAVLTFVLNLVALWKQEARSAATAALDTYRPAFSEVWQAFTAQPVTMRLLTAVALGATAFAMQDALLEPYGGEILGLSVGATTALTGAWALGALVAFTLSARWLGRGTDSLRIAGYGVVVGIAAFMLVIFAAPMASPVALGLGSMLIGAGAGLFLVGTLTTAMALSDTKTAGLALGAWGAVQTTFAGIAIALGGVLRDVVSSLAVADGLGHTLAHRSTGYATIYIIEICLLLATLVVLGPLVGQTPAAARTTGINSSGNRFGLTEFPT